MAKRTDEEQDEMAVRIAAIEQRNAKLSSAITLLAQGLKGFKSLRSGYSDKAAQLATNAELMLKE